MIDRLFKITLNTDWVTPALSMWGDFCNGSRADFAIDWDCGWSANEVGGLLGLHGIDYWGLMVRNDMILFSVKISQYKWVMYILQLNGIIEYEAEE